MIKVANGEGVRWVSFQELRSIGRRRSACGVLEDGREHWPNSGWGDRHRRRGALPAGSRDVPRRSHLGRWTHRRDRRPTLAARFTFGLHWNRWEEPMLVLLPADCHRLVGTAIVGVGRVHAARLSTRPILFGAQASGRVPTSSSATDATALPVPQKARNAPSVIAAQRAAGTALSRPITWWWSADGGTSWAFRDAL